MSAPVRHPLLYKYLAEREADRVVLAFQQIEHLLGFALPAPARTDPSWWTDAVSPDRSNIRYNLGHPLPPIRD